MNIVLFIIIGIILATAVYGSLSAAPWLPTKSKDVKRMVDSAEVKNGDIVYDLGCGDGRLVFASAKAGARATGYEVFVIPYLIAKIRSLFIKNGKILFKDFFRVNTSDADVVFIFLTYRPYKKLISKLNKELNRGSKVVVYCFKIKEWSDKLIKTDRSEKELPIYVYEI